MQTRAVPIAIGLSVLALNAYGAPPQRTSNSVKYRDEGAQPATGQSGSATLAVRALLGKDGNTTVEMTTGEFDWWPWGPGNISKVKLVLLGPDEARTITRSFSPDSGGTVALSIPDLQRGQPIDVQAHVTDLDPARTDIVQVSTRVYLRPDLRVSDLTLPPEIQLGTPTNITAIVSEINGDVGARADAVLWDGATEVDRIYGLWVDGGGSVSVAFTHTFLSLGQKDITVSLEWVNPTDYDDSNHGVVGSTDVVLPEDLMAASWWLKVSDYREESSSRRLARYTFDQRYRPNPTFPLADHGVWVLDATTGSSVYIRQGTLRVTTPTRVTLPLLVYDVAITNDGAEAESLRVEQLDYGWYYDPSCSCIRRTSCAGTSTMGRDAIICHIDGAGSIITYSTFGGDVTYFSSRYDSLWTTYNGVETFSSYTYNSESGDDSGVYYPLGSTVGAKMLVVDANGEVVYVDANVALQTFVSDHRSEPYTCSAGNWDFGTFEVCTESASDLDWYIGEATGGP